MIDHLILGAPDLGDAVDELERRFGVRAAPGGKHAGLGTRNALLALGARTYLEILAPDTDEPDPPNARPFGIDELTAPRLVGWAVTCDDIDVAVAASREVGYDPGDAVEMTRTAPDGTVLRWRLTLNALGGGPVPFLIAWGATDHPASSAPRGLRLAAFEIESPDPEPLAATLHVLGADVAVKAAGALALVAHIQGPAGTEELR
jgi:hypothetical protein